MPPVSVPQAFAMALQHHQAGRLAEAEALYRQILAAQPNHAFALCNLGEIWRTNGHIDAAIDAYRRALSFMPNYPEAYNNLGVAWEAQGKYEDAISAHRQALALRPHYPEASNNLGTLLSKQGELDEAIACFHRAINDRPNYPKAHNNLGTAFSKAGQIDQAIFHHHRAVELQPHYPLASFNESLLLLLQGDFERGWPLFESRWETHDYVNRHFAQPRWDGTALNGKRLLIHAEQGFGDAIQFIRYATFVAERGGKVIFECHEHLTSLLRGARHVDEVVVAGQPLPAFDFHVPMLSLPLVCRTTPANIPNDVPYLFCDAERQATWRQLISRDSPRAKIGLAWAGNPKHFNDRHRSLKVDQLLPILESANVDFFSLQVNHPAGRISELPKTISITDHTDRIHDFADTAALVAELDLVICVDTAVAHLSGALGRPVWTLLQFVPDWRWGLEGEMTPWYPTMRLFRQRALGEWDAVIHRVAEELKRTVAARA